MRLIVVLLVSFGLSGCAVIRPMSMGRSSKSAALTEKCPPGHRWSDGKCHDKGKGHDPAKKVAKKRKA
jgi:hypothetical protein